ncbi:MAG: hypothetical protein FWF88_00075 [Peptococcaceae bacterium]|nr:hypothetical protein [Peptococcaceae bacterium]
MISSGVLAFYLSETEDPELWRAMAQLTQDERTEFFKSALSYLLIEEGQIPPGDYSGTNSGYTGTDYGYAGTGYDHAPDQHLSTSSPQTDPSHLHTGRDEPANDDYGNAGYGTEQAYGSSGYRQGETHQDVPSMREWYEDTQGSSDRSNQWEVRGTRHTLTPTFSQPQPKPQEQTFALAQAQLMSHQARLKQLFIDSSSSQASPSKPISHNIPPTKAASAKTTPGNGESKSAFQPELRDVVLEDLYSNGAAPGQDLRGLDFLLKNVIGEETDEAVLDAIRRKRRS